MSQEKKRYQATKKIEDKSRRNNYEGGYDSHVYYIDQAFIFFCHNNDKAIATVFRDNINQLKRLRVSSDYREENVDEKGIIAKTIALEVLKIINKFAA